MIGGFPVRPLLLIALTVGCYDPSTSCGEACALDAPAPDAVVGAVADTWFGQGAGDSGPHPYDPILWVADPSTRVTLLRFDLATAPSGVLASAVLHFWVVNDSGDFVIAVSALLESWSEDTASWTDAATGVAWSTSGAEGAARGTVATTFLVPTEGTTLDVGLPAELVASWRDDPAHNYGLVLSGSSDMGDAAFASREDLNPGHQPTLSLVLQ